MPRNPEALSIGVGTTQYSPEGARIVVSKFENPLHTVKRPASNTAIHEAKHAVVALENGTSVRKVTVIPGAGYSGLTELSRPDPIAAAAPHADGMNGTGHDVSIIRLMGHDVSSMSAIARGITARKRYHIEAVARDLDARGTISGSDVQRVMGEVDKGESSDQMPSVTVFIKKPDGTENKISLAYYSNDIVMIPNEWIRISGKKQ